jgi:hypothetical protein
MKRPRKTRRGDDATSDADDPFAVFTEWASHHDDIAYRDL